jgi:hypothetical protein
MNQYVSKCGLAWIALLLSCLAVVVILVDQSKVRGQVSAGQRWNPRRTPPDTEFLGDPACGNCHKKLFAAHGLSGMRMTMEPVADSKLLIQYPKLTMREGPYSYELRRNGKLSTYSVTDGKETISLPVLYAIGQGRMGQTFVLAREGKFYESRVSFYNDTKALDFTIGTPTGVPKSLADAVGRPLPDNEVSNCFSCHSTGAVRGSQLNLDKMIHGVRCEGCHGPGAQHVAAIKEGEPGTTAIFNPGRLNGDELSQRFCASCHRGAEEFGLLKSLGINNVRFQPYRIFNSECYSEDRRIGCTACHNPHDPLQEDAAYYDAKCLACHALKNKPAIQGSLAACPVATKDCASCHMPKTEIPGSHFKFTDHYIRVVKPGEKYPN